MILKDIREFFVKLLRFLITYVVWENEEAILLHFWMQFNTG